MSSLMNHNISCKNNVKGVLWASLSVFLFSIVYISGKFSGGQISAAQLIWFRYIGATIFIVLWLIIKRSDLRKIRRNQVPLHALRALTGGLGGMAAIYAAANMNVASATAIGLLDGLFTILLGILLLREKFSLSQWFSAMLCLLGALFIIVNSGELSLDGTGSGMVILIALAGALLVAVESILIKVLARSEPIISILLHVSIFGSLIFFIPAVYEGFSIDWKTSLVFLFLGPIALAGQLCNIIAFRHSDAAVIGPIRYTWIIWGSFLGWVLFEEKITLEIVIGSILILLGGAFLAKSRTYTI